MCVRSMALAVRMEFLRGMAILEGRQQQQQRNTEIKHYLCSAQKLTRFVVLQLDFWVFSFQKGVIESKYDNTTIRALFINLGKIQNFRKKHRSIRS